MKKALLISLFSAIILSLLLISSCKTAETFVWNPTGTWVLNLDYNGNTCEETVTLSGSDSTGSVTGFEYCNWSPPQTGTFAKTGDYSITIFITWLASWGETIIITLNLNSTEASPNTVTGSGSSQENGGIYPCTITGIKTTNLQ